jgi:hypothetical protein
MSERITVNQLREIARSNPGDIRVIGNIKVLEKVFGELLSKAKENETEFHQRISNRLHWFDGSPQSWARLRGTLTMKLRKDLDWWLDECNESMILGFVEAITDIGEADEIIDTATAKKILGTTSNASFGRWVRKAGIVKVDHGKWRRFDIENAAAGNS